ncbi:aspartyl-phosphate phosphatase Spo0E family protein [Bacillus dakarensis]|uniref:aspartyl-phosphate phosphatase Spo0E family protein n=1 Tax=Robertmurraya dakarensis TaxID=1926278 RepID=UPI000981A8BF|nr:aspartyl-phosphate phosphatase Spo0E family protein [Bacillus dakarensis]
MRIEIRIEKLRKEMIKAGLSEGFTHPSTILLSKKLDRLMNLYQLSDKNPNCSLDKLL